MKLISVFDLCRDPPFLYINLNELQKFGPYDRMQDFILWVFVRFFKRL